MVAARRGPANERRRRKESWRVHGETNGGVEARADNSNIAGEFTTVKNQRARVETRNSIIPVFVTTGGKKKVGNDFDIWPPGSGLLRHVPMLNQRCGKFTSGSCPRVEFIFQRNLPEKLRGQLRNRCTHEFASEK